ncbi:MAG: amidohydrolase family protein [Acidobacteriota bacterium]|nr:amidohydrolase family protein [Acidobacteriota bacterium]
MKCSGIDVATGQPIEVEFEKTITSVRVLEEAADDAPWLAPGFVDLQVNGFAGIDFNNPNASLADLSRAVDTILRTGVTRLLPTVITGSPDDMRACLRRLRQAQSELPRGAAIVGFHVEGPAIGPDDGPRGAHPARWVRPPSLEEFRRWQEATDGNIRLITLSPHWPEAPAFIAAVTKEGVTASIGHTGASAEAVEAAVDAGATLSTHLGNGAHAVLRRHPNYLWDQLAEDRLSASFIVDGIHVGQAFLRTALRAKTVPRTVLVTDASAPAGAAPGRYRLGEQEADLTADGRVVLAGTDKLAGSALHMNDAIMNVVRLGGLSLRDAVQTATLNPARILGLEGRQEGLVPGQIADIVAFRADQQMRIVSVYLDGTRVDE